ncbi:MAG TPA: carboxypeptidase-like regulatory domain-containing protein, partial [Paludibacteraceae bacterium]|nr:carboxypeptidase-like regulatory domain-containing protein [Paludibacteraceae bacterium]
MKKLFLILFVFFLCIPLLMAETSIKGTVKSADTQNPIPGVIVSLIGQNISTQTNAEGQFSLRFIEAGDQEIRISKIGYFTQIK